MDAESAGDLLRLARLIAIHNEAAEAIAKQINRPALVGHVGEYIAGKLLDIALHHSANFKGEDGIFQGGSLRGASVDVKWYPKLSGMLDIQPNAIPDFYLVLTGPAEVMLTSRGATRPWYVDAVYLFETSELLPALQARGIKIGVATSVAKQYWRQAMIYPRPNNPRLILSPEQREVLGAFGSK